jgi:hypothetical protein
VRKWAAQPVRFNAGNDSAASCSTTTAKLLDFHYPDSGLFPAWFLNHTDIPQVTIEGTPDDWQRIHASVKVLATYGLEWWVSRLRSILDEFVLAAERHPTQEFWKAIYKPV